MYNICMDNRNNHIKIHMSVWLNLLESLSLIFSWTDPSEPGWTGIRPELPNESCQPNPANWALWLCYLIIKSVIFNSISFDHYLEGTSP